MGEEQSKILDIARRFIETLAKSGIRVSESYLYGSFAKGMSLPDSDIDIAVISADFTGDSMADWLTLARARRQIDTRIEAVPFRPEKFHEDNPLVWEIKQTGIKL